MYIATEVTTLQGGSKVYLKKDKTTDFNRTTTWQMSEVHRVL